MYSSPISTFSLSLSLYRRAHTLIEVLKKEGGKWSEVGVRKKGDSCTKTLVGRGTAGTKETEGRDSRRAEWEENRETWGKQTKEER